MVRDFSSRDHIKVNSLALNSAREAEMVAELKSIAGRRF
jgi:hypothetical protein